MCLKAPGGDEETRLIAMHGKRVVESRKADRNRFVLGIHNRKAGLQWTCLDFRHTFGSRLAMKGESLYKISALMGN